jgi:hypothetical protein
MSTEIVFEALKKILLKYENKLQIVHNKPDNYYLHTASTTTNAKGEFFGAVQVKKSYVAFHLMPVYYHPDLLNGISVELKKHMQGKSCFNFNNADKTLLAELKIITQASYEKYKALGKVQ